MLRHFLCVLSCLFLFQGYAQKSMIDSIVIAGNKVTRESTILRELPFSEGSFIANDSIRFYEQKINEILLNTSLFNYVTTSVEMVITGHCTLKITVEERWYWWPYPIFEQADRNLSSYFYNQEWNRLNYGFYMVRYNLFGKRQTLKAKVRFGYKEQYGLMFHNPSLHLQPKLGIYFDISGFRQKEIYYNTKENKPVYFNHQDVYIKKEWRCIGGLEFKINWSSEIFINWNYYITSLSDTVLKLNPRYLNQNESHSAGSAMGFSVDKRDIHVYPLKGYRVEMSSGVQFYNEKPEFLFSGKVGYHKPLSDKWFASSTLYGSYIAFSKLPFYYRYQLGNDLYIRGYELNLITGNAYLISKNTMKFAILKPRIFQISALQIPQFNKVHYAVYMNFFIDAGYISISPSVADNYNNQMLYSFGTGLDLVTYYDKIFRIECTRNNMGLLSFNIHAYIEL